MLSLRDAMDQLFEDSFIRPRRWVPSATEASLPLDMYETADAMIVKARLPGLKAEDVDINIVGDSLTIKGRMVSEADKDDATKWNWIHHELWHGPFARTVILPTMADANKAEASFENGVLTLTIPKAEEVKPKTIKVKAK
jgi:HSP20 family protein